MTLDPFVLITLVTLSGLLVGSLITVIAYRTPLMMQREWRNDCAEFLDLPDQKAPDSGRFNWLWPLPHCPRCKTKLRAIEVVPLLSFIAQKGRCRHCQEAIGCHYPMIELITGLASGVTAWQFGYSLELAAALLFTWTLVALSAIDIKQQLLPDSMILPLLWMGLFISLSSVFSSPEFSIIGALAGYLFLWVIYQAFKLVTGKEGMGHGDFKLLAALGAWVGWIGLPIIILLASVTAVVIGLSMILFVKHDRRVPIPFGPYLSLAGWLALLFLHGHQSFLGYGVMHYIHN